MCVTRPDDPSPERPAPEVSTLTIRGLDPNIPVPTDPFDFRPITTVIVLGGVIVPPNGSPPVELDSRLKIGYPTAMMSAHVRALIAEDFGQSWQTENYAPPTSMGSVQWDAMDWP